MPEAVPPADAGDTGGYRSAELAGTLCLATDVAMGFPFEHGLHSALVAMRLADRLGVDAAARREAFYASLLSYSDCTADADIAAGIFGGSMTTHFVPVMFGSALEGITGILRALPDPRAEGMSRRLQAVRGLSMAVRHRRPHLQAMCEVAATMAGRLGLPASISDLFGLLTERWDGKSPLRRAAGEEIPLALRIVHVARDAVTQRALGGESHALAVVRGRAGRAFAPDVVACLSEHPDVLSVDVTRSAWSDVLDSEPSPHLTLDAAQADAATAGIGDFADLVSPYFTGHSRRVGDLASEAAAQCGMSEADVTQVRRAGLLHDVGRVAVDARVWLKPGPLSVDEWEQVRLHPYHTSRVLHRSSCFSEVAAIAGAHHERLDGNGYHRGALRADLPFAARLVAAADVYAGLVAARPHRPPVSPDAAAAVLSGEAREGRLDGDAVASLLEADGHGRPKIDRPGKLTDREVDVVRLLATGRQTKQVAHTLGISIKTADRHIQNAYRKIGVSSRAGATLFAMEHGLVAGSDLPRAARRTRPERA